MAATTIGILRVLLTASSAEFETAMKSAAKSAQAWSKDLKAIGQQASQVGTTLTKVLTLPLLGIGVGAAKAAMDFESSFAGVRKTVKATEAEFAVMAQGFRDLAKTIPVNVNELNRLGEAAGALGIPKAEVVDFARVMALLGVTTNVTADQAAESIAKIQNIFGAAGKDTERFASTLVALGNDSAATEGQILEMATRIAGAGNVIGLTQGQVLGFASALSSVGLEAEAGGTAISRVFIDMASAVSKGGVELAQFAKVAGMSGQQFAQTFKTDAAGAVTAFIEGLGRIKTTGGDLIGTLEAMGVTEVRLRDTLLRVAGAGDVVTKSQKLQADAWRENTALAKEAEERFKVTEERLKLLWGRVKDVGITLGNALLPAIKSAIGAFDWALPIVDSLARGFGGLPGPVQALAVGLGLAVAAAGPAVYVFGQLALSASALGVSATGAATGLGLLRGALLGVGGVIGLAFTGALIAGMKNFDDYKASMKGLGAEAEQLAAASARVGTAITDLGLAQKINAATSDVQAKKLAALAASALTWVQAFKGFGHAITITTAETGRFGKATFQSAEELKKAAAAAKAHAAEISALNDRMELQRKNMQLMSREWADRAYQAYFDSLEQSLKSGKAHIEAWVQSWLNAKEGLDLLVKQSGTAVRDMLDETNKRLDAGRGKIQAWANAWIASHKSTVQQLDALTGLLDAVANLTGSNFILWLADVTNGMARGRQAGQNLANALKANDWAAFAAGAAQAVTALDQATNSTNRAQNAIGGAFTGAQIGAGFGGYGAAVGAVAGALVGLLRSTDANTKSVHQMRQEMLQAAGGLEKFQDAAKQAGIQTEALFNTNDAIEFEAALKDINAQFAAWNARVKSLTTVAAPGLKKLIDNLVEMGDVGQDQFDRLSRYALVTFGAIVKETGSLSQAFDAVGPSIDVLIELQAKFGTTTNETVQELLNVRKIVNANKEVMDSIDGLTQLMMGLSDAGFVTKDLFVAMADDVTSLFNKLVTGGATSTQAMVLMQPALQRLWELQNEYHVELDATTQALLDQATEQNIVGENHKSVSAQMLSALLKIEEAMRAVVTILNGGVSPAIDAMGQRARNNRDDWRSWRDEVIAAAQAAKGALDTVTPPAPGPAGGGSGKGSPYHAGGYVMHGGGLIDDTVAMMRRMHSGGVMFNEIPALLQRGEYVVSRRGVQAVGRETLDLINRGGVDVASVMQHLQDRPWDTARFGSSASDSAGTARSGGDTYEIHIDFTEPPTDVRQAKEMGYVVADTVIGIVYRNEGGRGGKMVQAIRRNTPSS